MATGIGTAVSDACSIFFPSNLTIRLCIEDWHEPNRANKTRISTQNTWNGVEIPYYFQQIGRNVCSHFDSISSNLDRWFHSNESFCQMREKFNKNRILQGKRANMLFQIINELKWYLILLLCVCLCVPNDWLLILFYGFFTFQLRRSIYKDVIWFGSYAPHLHIFMHQT